MQTLDAPVAQSSTLPLGFLALFTATTVYSAVQLQWLPRDSGVTVAACVLAATVMATTSVRSFVTGIAEITASERWLATAGFVGLFLAVVSFYAAFALATAAERGWAMPLTREEG